MGNSFNWVYSRFIKQKNFGFDEDENNTHPPLFLILFREKQNQIVLFNKSVGMNHFTPTNIFYLNQNYCLVTQIASSSLQIEAGK